jgi:hypothetical protein
MADAAAPVRRLVLYPQPKAVEEGQGTERPRHELAWGRIGYTAGYRRCWRKGL